LEPGAGTLENLAKPKPITTLDVLDMIHGGVDAVKNLHAAITAGTASDLVLNAAAQLNPIVAIFKDLSDNVKQHEDQNSLRQYLNKRLDDLDKAIDNYNQALQQIMDRQDDLKLISDGIDQACNAQSANTPNQ
jgi:ABC-type transporter Mla subunit MlaD